jgi:glycosyltransferase involved in cell wall biosynthesis
MLTVSVVIPCFNAEAFVGEALESVAAQTRRPLEVLVVDDASTDGSAEVIRAFEGVRLLENPVNAGSALSRNRALLEARGDVVAFLDADDVWLPHHLETVVSMLDAHPEAAVGFAAVEHFGSRSGVWLVDLPEDGPFDAFHACLEATCVPQMSAVARRDVLAAVGNYRQPEPICAYAEDYDLWLRIARRWPFVYTQKVTARYRWHPGQISQSAREKQVQAVYLFRRLLLDELSRDLEAYPPYRDAAREVRSCWAQEYEKAYRARDRTRIRLLEDVRRRWFSSMRRPPGVLVRSLVPMSLMRWLDARRGRAPLTLDP